MRSNGEESTSVDEALTRTAKTAVATSRDGQSGACDCDICRLSVCRVAQDRSCQDRLSIRLPRSAPQQFLSRWTAPKIWICTEITKRLGLAQADGDWGRAGSQPSLRRLTRSDERTASIDNTDKPGLSGQANSWTQLQRNSCYGHVYWCSFARNATACAPCSPGVASASRI
jgi:hypothetical protein